MACAGEKQAETKVWFRVVQKGGTAMCSSSYLSGSLTEKKQTKTHIKQLPAGDNRSSAGWFLLFLQKVKNFFHRLSAIGDGL